MPHAYVTAYTCDCMYMCYMKQSCALVPNRLASSLTHSHSSMAPGESRPSSATYTLCDLVLCLVTQSCPTLCNPMDCSPPGSSVHRDSPSKNTGVGCHALLQGIFPTQESNQGLLHCRQILYQLSYQGSPLCDLSGLLNLSVPLSLHLYSGDNNSTFFRGKRV